MLNGVKLSGVFMIKPKLLNMKKSSFRIFKCIFLAGFLLLFGAFVFLMFKQHDSNVSNDVSATDEGHLGKVSSEGQRRIGFEYKNEERSDLERC